LDLSPFFAVMISSNISCGMSFGILENIFFKFMPKTLHPTISGGSMAIVVLNHKGIDEVRALKLTVWAFSRREMQMGIPIEAVRWSRGRWSHIRAKPAPYGGIRMIFFPAQMLLTFSPLLA